MTRRRAEQEEVETLPKYHQLSDDVVTFFNDTVKNKSFPFKVQILPLGSSKQKFLIKLVKINEINQQFINGDFIALINEALFDKLDDESRTILFVHEIDKIHTNDAGKFRLEKPSVTTTHGLISKYGIDEIERALKLQDEILAQEEDFNQENTFIS